MPDRNPVGLQRRPRGTLWQYHAWPDRFAEMARQLSDHYGAPWVPGPGRSVRTEAGALLRIHPQRLWFVAESDTASHVDLPVEIGVALDLSHARAAIHIATAIAEPLLSRFVSVDLRLDGFPIDAIGLTPLHRVGVLLWRRADGFEILAPRSFAASIFDVLTEAVERVLV